MEDLSDARMIHKGCAPLFFLLLFTLFDSGAVIALFHAKGKGVQCRTGEAAAFPASLLMVRLDTSKRLASSGAVTLSFWSKIVMMPIRLFALLIACAHILP